MTRADMSTGVLQNALVALKLRSEAAESLTGVLQNAFPIPQASQRFGRIVDRGAPTLLRRRPFVNDSGQRCYDGEKQNTGGRGRLVDRSRVAKRKSVALTVAGSLGCLRWPGRGRTFGLKD